MRASSPGADVSMPDTELIFMNVSDLAILASEMMLEFETRLSVWPMNSRIGEGARGEREL